MNASLNPLYGTLLLVVCASLCACSLSDLRTSAMTKNGLSHTQQRSGRALINGLTEKHGGLQRWTAQQTLRATMTDTWPDWITRTAAMPWPESPQSLQADIALTRDTGRITLLNGPQQGAVWGLQNWVPYTAASSTSQPTTTVPEGLAKDITFWIPTLIYFLEAPFRLHEATVTAHVGERTVEGRTLEGVFLTWGSEEPQDHVDQYVAWIDTETGLLAFLEYTVRDIASFITGTMAYRDYEDFNGFQLPRTLSVVDGPGGDDTLHAFTVQSIEFSILPAQDLFPFPNQTKSKY